MGFIFDYARKIKGGIVLGHKCPKFGNAANEYGVPDKVLTGICKYCIGLYIDKLGGIYKMLYDLRNNNSDKKIYVMLHTEERRSMQQAMRYSMLSIGKDTIDEIAIHNIFSINYDMIVDSMTETEKEDGSVMRIYLKSPSCYVEVDE